MKKTRTLFFRMIFFATLYSLYSQAADDKTLCDVEIVVTGIKENSGTIVISIHDSSESFRKHIPYRNVEQAATGEKAVYRIRLKAGDYAFCVYHDVNGDGKLNANTIGIPKEPFGFSNYDGKGPPGNFKKHKVFIDGAATVNIPLVKMN
ncbi:DUF2141 domain-containing protein [Treponema sp. Marseille-Q4132]|uniref:DUF2141 domain-containing protein n=1 Tax=Treponema sp. Marseille-Q4132 TaxID=2766701 RepID=UPI001653289F|nr:DUF2141 domain-containing protein [Treponema sp. Marseille-Q4132]QNL97610.1 DUF2141 domain-containing protein [Treponema sp. Marseille-Q4132]